MRFKACLLLSLASCVPAPPSEGDLGYDEAAVLSSAGSPIDGDVYIDDYHCDGTSAKPGCVRPDGTIEASHGDDWARTIEYIERDSGQCGSGCTIRLGRKHYPLRSRATICRSIRLVGVGGGATPTSLPGSRLVVHPGASIKIAFAHECADRGFLGSGAGAVIEHLGICRPLAADPTRCGPPPPDPTVEDSTDALLIEAQATIHDVRIRGPFRHGIHITADANSRTCTSGCADGAWLSDASNWRVDDVIIDYTTNRGVYIHGGDTNTGVAINISVKRACMAPGPAPSGQCAFIHDDGFIGNTHIGHHIDGTDSPPAKGYLVEGDSHVVVGMYAESGFAGGNELSGPSIALGGKSTFSGGGLMIGAGKIRHAQLEFPRILKDSTGATNAFMLFDIPNIGTRVAGSDGLYLREYASAPFYGLFGSRYANTNLSDRGFAWLYDETPSVRKETFMPRLKNVSICDYSTMSCL